MATYKVPQDVEADDKLIGPFSFRQFIYLIIVALAGALAWGLAQLFIGLAIIPLPVILLFGALALPLRKDQPMEIYLAAIISFNIKPRKRKWDGEGVETLIEIIAPKVVEKNLTKDVYGNEAEERLSYLADIVDSGGWAIRGVGGASNTLMNSDVLVEARGIEDVLDTNTSVAQNFGSMMTQSTEKMKEEAMERMRQATMMAQAATPVAQSIPQPQQPVQQFVSATPPTFPVTAPTFAAPQAEVPVFNPYPADMNQSVIQAPVHDLPTFAQPSIAPQPAELIIPTTEPATSTSETAVDPGIMNLVDNTDLSIATLASEANRLQQQNSDSDEVVISLR